MPHVHIPLQLIGNPHPQPFSQGERGWGYCYDYDFTTSRMTLPFTSVRRKSRPEWRNVSCS